MDRKKTWKIAESILFVLTLVLLCFATQVKAQNCSQNLDNAKRAYYNGQLQQVTSLLEGCLEELDRADLQDAYKLLINTHLIAGESEKAEEYMVKLLNNEPLYKVQGSDLQEFKNLRDNYEAISQYSVGLIAGYLQPDYHIMRHHSVAGNADQPSDYSERAGISLGITGDIRIWQRFYTNISLVYDRRGFEQEETILGFQRVYSDETQQRLSLPLQVRYIQPIRNWNVFAGGGYGFHYLVKATGDFIHTPIEGDFPVIDGIPYFADNVDITKQHNRLTRSWQVSGGIQRPFDKYIVELRFTYERGLSNLIDEDNRYFSQELTEDFAYVPDDVRVHAFKFSLVFSRNFIRPQKKKN